jgi:dihydropteroate synthase
MVELPPLHFRRATFDWRRTVVMGIVNVTPDSFSDGDAFLDAAAAVAHGRELIQAGADLIDVGGESTRPGATAVGAQEEAARAIPVVRALAEVATVSIDTYKAEIAAAALEAGAEIINDVSGGAMDPDMLGVAAKYRAALILGHLRGSPADMVAHARYADVVRQVVDDLAARVEAAVAAGVPRARILIDPGLGFAKTAVHNLMLLAHLRELAALGCAIVVGASRKSFLGHLSGASVDDREIGTAAAHTAAILHGAQVVRVHDVARQRAAVLVADALRSVV